MVASLLQHINKIEPSIQFILETENSVGCLPFLDVQLRGDDGYIATSVYRKPTHTDKYLDFASHHPLMHKTAVVRTLFCRADSLSSSDAHINEEYTRIFNSLKTNHYPDSFIKRFSQKRSTTHEEKSYKKTGEFLRQSSVLCGELISG